MQTIDDVWLLFSESEYFFFNEEKKKLTHHLSNLKPIRILARKSRFVRGFGTD